MAIIVFLNEEEQTVTIIDGKDVNTLPWSDIGKIAFYIADQEILYVTGAEQVHGQSVIDLLEDITGQACGPPIKKKSSAKFFYSKSPSKIVCRGAGGDLIFNGPADMKAVNDLPSDILETNFSLQKCIELGKIEIISDEDRKNIISVLSKKKKTINAKDAAIDSILIKGSVDKFLNKEDNEDSDAIRIDIDE